MKILITGGTGLIGSAVIWHIIEKNIVGAYNMLEVARNHWLAMDRGCRESFRFHHRGKLIRPKNSYGQFLLSLREDS